MHFLHEAHLGVTNDLLHTGIDKICKLLKSGSCNGNELFCNKGTEFLYV
jgi:hypothetical protein